MYTIICAVAGFVFVAIFYRSGIQLHVLGPSATLLDCFTNNSYNIFTCQGLYGQFVPPLIFGALAGGALGFFIDKSLSKKQLSPAKSTKPDAAGSTVALPVVIDSLVEPVQPTPELKEKPVQEPPRQLTIDDSPDGLLDKGLSFMQIAEGCSTDREYLQLMSKAYQQIRQAIEKGGSSWSERASAEELLNQIRGAVNSTRT